VLPYGAESESPGGRRQVTVAVVFVLVALVVTYLPEAAQQQMSSALRASLLRPFIETQRVLVDTRVRASEVEVLQARLDSLTTILSTQATLAVENRRLRALLELGDRVGPSYRAASVLRPGTPGSESMFLLLVGAGAGVVEGAPVVDRRGLVGVIREVRPETSVGMDWTHPDFRASAMVADGSSFGMVENRRGAFREEDRLVLTGGAYHEEVADGTLVVTSGLGGVFPRGIPIGRVDGVAEVQAQWRKSYWLEPMVEPASASHVLVQVGQTSLEDMTRAFLPDSLQSPVEVPAEVDSAFVGPPSPPPEGPNDGPGGGTR